MQRECPSQSARLELHVRLGCCTRERLELWHVLEGGPTWNHGASLRSVCFGLYSRQHRAARSQSRAVRGGGASKLWRTEEAPSNELVRQRRSYTSLFGLFESWGAIAAFLYMVLGLTAKTYNAFYFNRQVRGLDIRKLDKGQFTPFGRLIDKSFQMPREYQCMSAD